MQDVLAFLFLGLIWVALVRLCIVTVLSLLSLRQHWPAPLADLSCVTVVIPAHDEAKAIDGVLRAASRVVAQGARLIVVDDGSLDTTAAQADRWLKGMGAGARLIRLPRNLGKAGALNHGLQAVTTPLVLTIDADTSVEPDAVGRALAALLADPGAGVVAFDVRVPPSPCLFAEVQGVEYDAALNFERRGQGLIGAISVAPGAASLWRIDDLRGIGGFPAATVTEDVDATLALAALGRRAIHVAAAVADTDPPTNLRHLLAQRRRWSLGHFQNLPRHRPRPTDAAALRWLVWPNFAFLCLFLPATAVCAIGMLIFGTGGLQSAIWASTGAWLPIVYGQRLLGLWVAGRKSHPFAVLIEPFSTTALHTAAAFLVLTYWLRAKLGRPVDPWGIRD